MRTQIGVAAWSFLFWNFGTAYFVFARLFPATETGIEGLIYWQITAIIGHVITMYLWLKFWKWKRHGKGANVKALLWTYLNIFVVTAIVYIIRQAFADGDFSNALGMFVGVAAGLSWVFFYFTISFVIDGAAGYLEKRKV